MNTTQQTPGVMDTIITEHNTTGNEMIQHFGDRSVQLVTDYDTHRTGLLINEELCILKSNMSIHKYIIIQEAAFLIWLSMQN